MEKVRNYVEKHRSVLLRCVVIASLLFVLASSSYTAIEGSRVLNFMSDSFISTFMAADWRPGGTFNLVSQHTNLMKFPLLALQGWLHYGYFSYILLNVILLGATALAWSYLVWRLCNRSSKAFVLSNLMLGGLLLGSTALVISSVSTTTRNIEYPISLVYLFMLRRLIKTGRKLDWILGVVILALLVSSDFLFLYTLFPAILLLLAWLWWEHRLESQQFIRTASNAIAGTGVGLFVLIILQTFHVLSLSGRHAGSFILFTSLPHDLYNTYGQILQLFGGFFLGSPIKISFAGQILCFFFAMAAMVIGYKVIRRADIEKSNKSSQTIQFIPLALVLWAICLCSFYVLLGQAGEGAGDNSRYLSALPFIAVPLILTAEKTWRHKSSVLILTATILVGGLMNSYHGYYTYKDSIQGNPQASIDQKIINYSREHDIQFVLGSYNYGAALRFYSHGNPQSYAILDCNNTFYFFSYNKWYSPSREVKHSAIIVDQYYSTDGLTNFPNSTNSCSQSDLSKIYGVPGSKVTIAQHNGQPVYLYVYNYDVRTKIRHSSIIYL